MNPPPIASLNSLFHQIFDKELENENKYENFTDFCETFNLKRGKTSTDEENETIGEFKVIQLSNR